MRRALGCLKAAAAQRVSSVAASGKNVFEVHFAKPAEEMRALIKLLDFKDCRNPYRAEIKESSFLNDKANRNKKTQNLGHGPVAHDLVFVYRI